MRQVTEPAATVRLTSCRISLRPNDFFSLMISTMGVWFMTASLPRRRGGAWDGA